MEEYPSQKTLKQYFTYHVDGYLTWKKLPSNRVKLGKRAGCPDGSNGYEVIRLFNRLYVSHRLIWIYHHGAIPAGLEIDHINRRRTDNKISNLRAVSRSLNRRNVTPGKRNKSGTVGVFETSSGYWVAQIKHNSQTLHLGHFKNKKEAINIRKEEEIKYGYLTNQ